MKYFLFYENYFYFKSALITYQIHQRIHLKYDKNILHNIYYHIKTLYINVQNHQKIKMDEKYINILISFVHKIRLIHKYLDLLILEKKQI